MKKKNQGVIVISTFSDEASAKELGARMVRQRLCACVNIAQVQSLYTWKGRLEDQKEYLALFKTTAASATKLKKAISELHPYELPEIIELAISDTSSNYLAWLASETLPHRVAQDRNYSSKR